MLPWTKPIVPKTSPKPKVKVSICTPQQIKGLNYVHSQKANCTREGVAPDGFCARGELRKMAREHRGPTHNTPPGTVIVTLIVQRGKSIKNVSDRLFSHNELHNPIQASPLAIQQALRPSESAVSLRC